MSHDLSDLMMIDLDLDPSIFDVLQEDVEKGFDAKLVQWVCDSVLQKVLSFSKDQRGVSREAIELACKRYRIPASFLD